MKSNAARRRAISWCAVVLLTMAAETDGADDDTGPSNEINSTSTPAEFNGDVPSFVEQAGAAGIDHHYTGGWEYFVGGGVAAFDCNDDRLPDLFMAGGAGDASLHVNRSKAGGALKFERLTDAATDIQRVTGAYPLDVDNDGRQDLVLLRVGENRILRGLGDCRFEPAERAWSIDGGNAWSTAFSATQEADRAFPTLAFGNYVDRSAPGSPWGTCHDNVLMRPALGETPDYSDPITLTPGYCTLSMRFTDWNRSGSDDLRISNDRQYHRGGEEQLWHIDAGRYPRRYTRNDGWASLVIWGMGIGEADLDADGYPEYVLTSMGDTRLQTLDVVQADHGRFPAYEDIAYERNVTAHRPYSGNDLRPSTGWHAEFADLNNDGHSDLFIAKGNVERMSDFANVDPDNLLLARPDGRFVEQGDIAGLALPRQGRGAAVVDLNADGLLDLVVVNRNGPASLFRHDGMLRLPDENGSRATRSGGNWLKIELVQAGSNRQALGATLSVRTGNHVQSRRLQIGGGHASGHAGFVHVGLGVAERATLRIQWPDGEWSAPFQLFANQHVIIERGRERAMQWFPVE